MTNNAKFTWIGCAALVLLIVTVLLISGLFADNVPDRSDYDSEYNLGSIQKFQGEVLFVSKYQNGYVIYMDQREYQPNSLMEFLIHEDTLLFDDQDGAALRKMLEKRDTGWTALVGCWDHSDKLVEGHNVRPVEFIYDKTPAQ